MTIFVYKELTRNPEIWNITVWVLANIWRLGRVRDTKFGTNVSNKMLLNAVKWKGYSFYCFWIIKGKPITGVKLPSTQIRIDVICGIDYSERPFSKNSYYVETSQEICNRNQATGFYTNFYWKVFLNRF